MNAQDRRLARRLSAQLTGFAAQRHRLRGIEGEAYREAFLEQLVDSVRRIRFVLTMRDRDLSDRRADPSSHMFDPLRAAVLRMRQGDREEAFWLVFLSVHFGKSGSSGWRLVRDIYSGVGGPGIWTWEQTSGDPAAFRNWLEDWVDQFREDGVARHFGNHRKYESLDPRSSNGTGAVVESYVTWVAPPRTHDAVIAEALEKAHGGAREAFDHLYRSMDAVRRFGRTAKFDYLTMLGKLGLAPIEAGSTYMRNATGPLSGARLLFGGDIKAGLRAAEIEQWLVELEAELDIGPQGMQVLEDALCNWQKHPDLYRPFRG